MSNRLMLKTGWVAAITAVLLISACGDRKGAGDIPSPSDSASPSSSAAAPSVTPSPTASAPGNQALVEEFVQHASSDIAADQLMIELSRSVAAASPTEADEMIRAMDEYYSRNLPEAEKQFQAEEAQKVLSSLKFPFTHAQYEGLKNEEVRKMVLQATAGGYKLETSEGFVFPVVDYAALLALADKASAAMTDYLSIMAAESEHKTMTDAAFAITRDELVNRMAAAETYAKQYPDTPEYDKVEQRFLQYLTLYLVGLDNTANYDDSYHVLPEIKSHFKQTVLNHPGTVTAKLTAELLDVLEKTKGAFFNKADDGMQVDIPEMKAFRDGIEKKAKDALKVSGA